MGFSRQEYWSGLPFPSPGDLPDPGIEPGSPTLQADSLGSEPPGNPLAFQIRTQYQEDHAAGMERQEKVAIPLLLWFNVKEPQLPPLLGRKAFRFLFLFLLLPVSEVLQDNSLALQVVLEGLLAHAGHAPPQEGPHEGLGPLGSHVLLGDKMVRCCSGWDHPGPWALPHTTARAGGPPSLTHLSTHRGPHSLLLAECPPAQLARSESHI